MEIPWLSKIRVEMEAKNLDILAVIPGPNMQYLTGLEFHLMERPIVLLISQTSNPILVIPQLEENRDNKLISAGYLTMNGNPIQKDYEMIKEINLEA